MSAPYIHPRAFVEEGALLAEDVRVGPMAYVAAQARLGLRTQIGPLSVIHGGVTIGADCRIHAGAVLGDLPQDLAYNPDQPSYVEIGEGCVIREGATIHRGTKPGTTTAIGDHCFIMANAHVGHNCRLGPRVILVNGVLLGGYVEVGPGAFLGGGTVVHQFVRLGRLVMTGGLSGISKDVPPFCMVASARRNRVSGLNVVGLRRTGVSVAERLAIKRAFGLLYRSGLRVTEAVARLRDEFPDGPASEFASFIEQSQRGLCSLRSHTSRESDNE